MVMQQEWLDRLNLWRNTLRAQKSVKLGSVELKGFCTRDQLPFEQANRGKFKPMPVGLAWGGKWEYGWFKTAVVAPKEANGKRLVFHSGAEGESLIFVNGVARGANSWAHEAITLSRRARAGEKFEVLVEAYAGHGPTPCRGGPVVDGKSPVPEPPAKQRKIGETWFGVRDEDAFQLMVDVETLLSLRDNDLDKDSLRAQQIDEALRNFTTIVDFELPLEQRRATYREARRRLAPLLRCRNGSTTPDMFAFGHAHLDVEWLWPLAETRRKAARTFSSQLELMDEYPFYKFLQTEPQLYRMVKNDYPELYARLRKAVRSGNIVPEGGMWVEPDMNLTGGESLVRQCIHGKRFFHDEFGVDNRLLWLPDVFGYSAALPQILLGCGIKYFSTTKIFWNYHGGQPFPYNTFMWEGIDGSRILSHLFASYGGSGYPKEPIARWRQRPQKDGLSSMIYCFGYGDGGGGATREMIESVIRMRDLEGCPRVRFAGPLEFFRDLEKSGVPAALYVGEIYFQAHRGCLTTQAKTKRGNRKSEYAMREAEMWSCAATALAGFGHPRAMMDETWKMILLNQFHDILPGSSIQRVYDETNASYDEVIRRARQVASRASSRLLRKTKGATIFNSLSWNRTSIVKLPAGLGNVADAGGKPLPVQKIGADRYVEVDVPSCGWTSVTPADCPAPANSRIRVEAQRMENELIRIRLNDRGEIASIYDKTAGRELAAGPCNSFRMFKDVPSQWEAWDVESNYAAMPVPLNEKARFKVMAKGPLLGRLQVTRKLHDSTLTQTLSLRRNSRRVDFHTTIDWNETHKLLKVAFPVDIHTAEAVHEIQFGHLRRPNHRTWQFDADRYEVSNHKWTALAEEGRGFAVLNDCKYGVSTLGNCISLTLLRSSKAPDAHADIGRQEFTYSLYFWNGSLGDSRVVQEAYDLNVPATCVPGVGGTRSLFGMTAPNVIIEAVKPAEDGSGDMVVRMYESMRTATRCVLSTSLAVRSARETDMLEQQTKARLRATRKRIALAFRPFEIKTVRLALGRQPRRA